MNKTDVSPDYAPPDERGEYWTLPDGTKIYINIYDTDLLHKIRKLPAVTRINMMYLDEEDLEKYVADEKLRENCRLLDLLKKKWYFRETGEVAHLSDIEIRDLNVTCDEVLKKCKSKKHLPLMQIRKIIEFFTKDFSDIYLKEDETT